MRAHICADMRITIQDTFFIGADIHPNVPARDLLLGTDSQKQPMLVSWRLHRLIGTHAMGPETNFPDLCRTCGWDSKENIPFVSKTVSPWLVHRPESHAAGLFAVTGKGAAFDRTSALRWDELPESLIVVIEAFRDDVPWTKPKDVDISKEYWRDECGITAARKSGRTRTFAVGFRDCTVADLKCSIPDETIQPLLTVEGAKTADRMKLLGPYIVKRK